MDITNKISMLLEGALTKQGKILLNYKKVKRSGKIINKLDLNLDKVSAFIQIEKISNENTLKINKILAKLDLDTQDAIDKLEDIN